MLKKHSPWHGEGKIRVVQVVQPSSGGTPKQVSYICSRLDSRRFDVHLIWSLTAGDPPYAESLQGVSHHRVDMKREVSPRDDLVALARIYRLLRRLRPHVVHAHSSKAGALARLAAFAAGVPRVFYSPRGYAFLRTDAAAISRHAYALAEWLLARLGSMTLAVSPDEGLEALRVSRPRCVRVLENGIDAFELPIPGISVSRHPLNLVTVGAIGRIVAPRAPLLFIEIAEELEQRLADLPLRFIWIGDGALRPVLEERIRRGKLRAGVEITGWLPRSKVITRLQDLDIVLMPSLWEGLPNAILEAMLAGKPVVASDIIGNRTAVVDGVTGYLARSLEDYVHGLETLIRSPEQRRTMGLAARLRAIQRFDLRRVISRLELLYSPLPTDALSPQTPCPLPTSPLPPAHPLPGSEPRSSSGLWKFGSERS